MKYLIPILSTLFLLGCLSETDPFGDPVDQTDFLEEYASQEGVQQTPSGLLYKVIDEGSGNSTPPSESIIFVSYEGTLISGETIFMVDDIDYFALSRNILIEGLYEGIQLMNEGARYEFVIPTELAYGNSPPDTRIRPGAVIIFDITLDSYLRQPQEFFNQNLGVEGVEQTESGLQYMVLEDGDEDGEHPEDGQVIKIRYTGTFTNGYQFDGTTGNNTERFMVGQTIDGFTEGVKLMKEGASFRFFIPPEIGYGDTPPVGSPIPPNVVLVFDVELDEIIHDE